jgi:hypothetical protein
VIWRRLVCGFGALTAVLSVSVLVALPAGAGIRSSAGSGYSGVLFRPVLCAVPPLDRFITGHQPAVAATLCGPSNLLSTANLAVTPDGSATGYSYQSPQPDTILEGVRTTKPAGDSPKKAVLLAGLRGSSIYSATPTSQAMRYLLGPSEMNSSAISSATASKGKSGTWVVQWTTTTSGGAQWDKVAHLSFHQMLAIDVGGVVVSAPIIEPTHKSFSSFKGRGEISGDLTQAEAMKIAQAMESQSG